MLYALHEMQHALLAPFEAAAVASHALFTQPHSPWAHTPYARSAAAANELVMRLVRRYEKPEWGIRETVVDGRTVPVHVEKSKVLPFCHLLHFKREIERKAKDPVVLIVAPLSGHHSTLLRDTVRTMLPEHEVYITDWIDARMVPVHEGHFHLDDYVHYVQDFIRHLGPKVHVISVCQPTVPVLAAISLMAANGEKIAPLTMTMMGGPIDTRRSPTSVNNFATGRPLSWFESRVIQRVPGNYPGVGRRVYPGFLQHASFIMMNAHRHVASTTRCSTWPPSTTSRPCASYSRNTPCRTARGTCVASAYDRRPSSAPPSSRSRANSTISPGWGRPRQPTVCAAASPRRSVSTTSSRAWVTMVSSAGGGIGKASTRGFGTSSASTAEISGSPPDEVREPREARP